MTLSGVENFVQSMVNKRKSM